MSDDLKSFKYDSVQDMETITAYLEAIAEGFRSGKLLFASQDKEVVYHPQGLVGLTIESKKKGARRKLSIKFGWKETDGEETKDTPPLVVKALPKDQQAMQDLEQNIRFMLLDVTKQVENTLECIKHSSQEAVDKVRNRDNYIDNMKSVVENICFSRIHGDKQIDKRGVDRLRAAHIISNNLERLADHAVNIAIQTQYLTDPAFITRYDYQPFFDEIFATLDMIYSALFNQDMSLAFKICMSEHTLDTLYKGQFDRILHELRAGVETGNLVTTLFTFRYLERIGDALLNIGEAVIFFILGEKFKIRQYNALRDTLSAAGREVPISNVEFQSIWGTRSGCRIGKIKSQDARDGGDDSRGVIFKEGEPKKLLQEKKNIERWQEIMPGLPPKVVALREEADSVSLLIEFLGGCTVQDVILTADEEIILNTLFLVESTVRETWNQTLKREPASGCFIQQAEARLPDVFRLYPEFDTPVMCIGNTTIPPLKGLIGEARRICQQLPAPFSVFIHGDFNINNIVYDHQEQRIHYIDLHRSRDTDYVQDVSVFLVSNFRLPIFDRQGRDRIEVAMREMLRFAREFAEQHEDTTFQARLCLGLIRSFLTSTRFELNRTFARSMYMRGVYLLRKLVAHKGSWDDFKIPLHVLGYYQPPNTLQGRGRPIRFPTPSQRWHRKSDMKKIAVVGIPGGWSTERLADAVEAKTGERILIDMGQVRMNLEDNTVWCGELDMTKLDGVIVKKIAPSYSPNVLDRLEMLRMVEQCGVPVFSKATSIMRLIDRLSCTVGLRLGGIPMPPTTITEDIEEAMVAVEEYGRAVFKPLFSSKARGMTVIEPGTEMREQIEDFKNEGNQVMYIQKMVENPGMDLGVTFLGGEYVATYARKGSGKSWDNTTRTGGKYVAQNPSREIIDLAHKAQALFDMSFTCVDVVETPDGPQIYEVSAFGGFRGLLDANGLNAADLYATHVLERIS